ncbi:PEP-CTERM sorting domain-containing protein [Massilia niastensis]|uniref:PEP-CTERM sorting domain-containing protein n=1 Tax=Massilia niastensis TaxID=544911 RepID=UPI0003659D82|nr:PEP-CTERM sorting domain-containing protein [Massilia niastensis]
MVTTLRRMALSLLLGAGAASASAGVITSEGVTFTSTFKGNVLTLEIDAAGRTGGWAKASYIDALSIKTIGRFTDVSMGSSTAAALWKLDAAELNAKGCDGGGGKGNDDGFDRLCYSGDKVALADNMLFTFTFAGDVTLGAPHLKVRFLDAKGKKAGDLLSEDFPFQGEIPDEDPDNDPPPHEDPPVGEVPEPQSLGLVAGGIAALGFVRRRRQRK